MFPGVGTITNAVAIVVMATLGALFGSLISKYMRKSIQQVVGLVVVLIGISGALAALNSLAQLEGSVSKFGVLITLVSLVIGTIIGELLKIEKGFHKFEKFLGKKLKKIKIFNTDSKDNGHRAFEGFITATLIFAIGAMTILGAIQDGLGDPKLLFLKAGLDGVTALCLASTLGISVALSAVPVLMVQGVIVLVVAFLGTAITATAIVPLEAVGGIMVTAIGLDILGIKRFSVGSMIPALAVALIVGFFL